MAGHSRSKNGRRLLAYVPALLSASVYKEVDARHKAGHDDSHYRQSVVSRPRK